MNKQLFAIGTFFLLLLSIVSGMVMMVIGVPEPSKACSSIGIPHDDHPSIDVYRSDRWSEDEDYFWITVHVHKSKASRASCKMQEGDIKFVNAANKRLEWISVAAECKVGVLPSHGGSRFRGVELFYAENIPRQDPKNPGQNFVRWDRVVRPPNMFLGYDSDSIYDRKKKYRWNCDACTFPETEFSAPDGVGNCCLTIRYKHSMRPAAVTDSVYVEPCSSVFIHEGEGFLN